MKNWYIFFIFWILSISACSLAMYSSKDAYHNRLSRNLFSQEIMTPEGPQEIKFVSRSQEIEFFDRCWNKYISAIAKRSASITPEKYRKIADYVITNYEPKAIFLDGERVYSLKCNLDKKFSTKISDEFSRDDLLEAFKNMCEKKRYILEQEIVLEENKKINAVQIAQLKGENLKELIEYHKKNSSKSDMEALIIYLQRKLKKLYAELQRKESLFNMCKKFAMILEIMEEHFYQKKG